MKKSHSKTQFGNKQVHILYLISNHNVFMNKCIFKQMCVCTSKEKVGRLRTHSSWTTGSTYL